MYSALMIDMKKSREYPHDDREEIQRFVIETCCALNRVFRESVVRGVEFSAGDEIQGLFSSPESAYLYYRWFSMLVSPVRVRAGIGVGSWDVQIEDAGTTAQDGTAYHNARRAIEKANEAEGYSILFYSNSKIDPVINSLIGAAAGITENMSDRQRELMLLAEVISPLIVEGEYRPEDQRRLCDLIRLKESIPYFREQVRNAAIDEEALQISPVYVREEEESFFVTSGRRRGIPSKLAPILGVSRQSVEKSLKTADISGARNLSITALRTMEDCQTERKLK